VIFSIVVSTVYNKRFCMERVLTLVCLIALMVGITGGCARQISSNVYSGASVGETSTTYPGVIISARGVNVEDKEYLEENTLGIVGGGLGGAYLGSKIGKGEGNVLATVGGAVAGAVAGAYAEKALKTQNAMEYVVALENGESKTVVQGPDPTMGVGQKVWLMVSHQGRSRVTPRL
jgi:outer membrane lipoprotein SlyB